MTPDTDLPLYALLTDAPPLREGGYGCHVLASLWLQATGGATEIVVTRRLSPFVNTGQVAAGFNKGVHFYPDLAGVPVIRRFSVARNIGELLLLKLYLNRIAAAVHASNAERLFAFFGASPWFLCATDWIARRTGLPFDVYLVDDLEESTRAAGLSRLANRVPRYESRLLRRASRVFAISPGYAEHLKAKYNLFANWLPIPIVSSNVTHRPGPSLDKPRDITFIGSVNHLYLGPLKDLVDLIRARNRSSTGARLRLLVVTYNNRTVVERALGGPQDIHITKASNQTDLNEYLRSSWAIFMPYSFDEANRTMVTTSFPTKLCDSMVAGRPILVYGPPYGSVPRYFRENHLPLCAYSKSELSKCLDDLANFDTPDTIASYAGVITKFHSPTAIRQRLSLGLPQIIPTQSLPSHAKSNA